MVMSSQTPSPARRADLRRPLHDHEAGAFQMLHKPPGDVLADARSNCSIDLGAA
jgi:hypothetical protein